MQKTLLAVAALLFFTIPTFADEVTDLLESAHQNFEGTPSERKTVNEHVGAWLRSFDFNQLAHQAHRWALVKQHDPKMREHVFNLAFLFPVSHMTEMIAGPLSAGINQFLNGPEWLTGTFLAVGTVISVPGFVDPLCILLLVSYKNVGFQKFVTKARLVVTRLAGATFGRAMAPLFERFNPMEQIQNLQTVQLVTEEIEGVQYLKTVRVQKNISEREWNLVRLNFKSLGWNISGLLADIQRGRSGRNSYVTAISKDEEFSNIELESLAFPVSHRLRVCRTLFR